MTCNLGLRQAISTSFVKGLKAGDRIVTSANFLIDSESQLQAAIGSFTPPPPGAGAAAAMNAPTASQQLKLNSQLSPQHRVREQTCIA